MIENVNVVYGVDPGFANIGFCKLVLTEDVDTGSRVISYYWKLVDIDVARTKKAKPKKRKRGEPKPAKVYSWDDIARRGKELSEFYYVKFGEEPASAVCSEAMSQVRNASAAGKVMLAWGVLIAQCDVSSFRLYQVPPKKLKEVITGSPTAEKDEVQRVLHRRVPEARKMLVKKKIPKGLWEHAYDALGAAVACIEGST